MTSAFLFFQRHRRMLALAAASIALHYLTLNWVGARIGAQPDAPAVVTAQLHLAVPAPLPAARPLPQPAPRPAPAPEPAPLPVAQPVSVAEAGPRIAEDESAGDSSAGSLSAAGIGAAPAAVAAPAPPVPIPPAPIPPAPAGAAPAARSYKVSLPRSAEFVLDGDRVDASGAVWSLVGVMSWHKADGKYKLSLEAGLNMLVTRINVLVLTSEGVIDENGIAPIRATETKGKRSLTATHFDRDAGRITYSASTRADALEAGTQDKATLPFQLAGIGRADPSQFAGGIDILVGEDKDANLFRFVLAGEEELDTKMGRLATWHLTRPPRPGTYSSRLDIWLAPAVGWYPVQIRNTEANGAVTTQTVSSITISDLPGK